MSLTPQVPPSGPAKGGATQPLVIEHQHSLKPLDMLGKALSYCAQSVIMPMYVASEAKKSADTLHTAVQSQSKDHTEMLRRLEALEAKFTGHRTTLAQVLSALQNCQDRLSKIEEHMRLPIQSAPIQLPPD